MSFSQERDSKASLSPDWSACLRPVAGPPLSATHSRVTSRAARIPPPRARLYPTPCASPATRGNGKAHVWLPLRLGMGPGGLGGISWQHVTLHVVQVAALFPASFSVATPTLALLHLLFSSPLLSPLARLLSPLSRALAPLSRLLSLRPRLRPRPASSTCGGKGESSLSGEGGGMGMGDADGDDDGNLGDGEEDGGEDFWNGGEMEISGEENAYIDDGNDDYSNDINSNYIGDDCDDAVSAPSGIMRDVAADADVEHGWERNLRLHAPGEAEGEGWGEIGGGGGGGGVFGRAAVAVAVGGAIFKKLAPRLHPCKGRAVSLPSSPAQHMLVCLGSSSPPPIAVEYERVRHMPVCLGAFLPISVKYERHTLVCLGASLPIAVEYERVRHTLVCLGASLPIAVEYERVRVRVGKGPAGACGRDGEAAWRRAHRRAASRVAKLIRTYHDIPQAGGVLDLTEAATLLHYRTNSAAPYIMPTPILPPSLSRYPLLSPLLALPFSYTTTKGNGERGSGADAQAGEAKGEAGEDTGESKGVVVVARQHQSTEGSSKESPSNEVASAQATTQDASFKEPSMKQRCRDTIHQLLLFALRRGGAAFIKWGQWASTREDLLPPSLCLVLGSLQDQAPTHSFSHTRRAVRKYLGCPLEDLFEEFERGALASGSIAQVHRARVRGACAHVPEWVVVKVRHPRVGLRIKQDFEVMAGVAAVVDRVPGLKWIRLQDSLEQFSHTMREQLRIKQDFEVMAGVAAVVDRVLGLEQFSHTMREQLRIKQDFEVMAGVAAVVDRVLGLEQFSHTMREQLRIKQDFEVMAGVAAVVDRVLGLEQFSHTMREQLRIKQDFEVMAGVAAVVDRVLGLEQFSHTMREQADLRVEAYHAHRLYADFYPVRERVVIAQADLKVEAYHAHRLFTDFYPVRERVVIALVLPHLVSEGVIVECFECGEPLLGAAAPFPTWRCCRTSCQRVSVWRAADLSSFPSPLNLPPPWQADLRVEAYHAHRLYTDFYPVRERVVIAQVLPHLVSEGVIVESFERGEPLHRFLHSKENSSLNTQVFFFPEGFERGEPLHRFLHCKEHSSLNTQTAAVGVDAYLKMLLQDSRTHIAAVGVDAYLKNLLLENHIHLNSLNRIPPHSPPSLPWQIAAVGVDAYLKMLLQDNHIHLDLHPGNILARMAAPPPAPPTGEGALQPEGQAQQGALQLVILDYGLMEDLSAHVRSNFLCFIASIMSSNAQQATHFLLRFAAPFPQRCTNRDALEADMRELFARDCQLHHRCMDLNDVLKKVGD
ncbi:unnamed protein product [Closterium sp. NIES-64]|nr:unnamed protein product [Closterium sp. NIES-64]